MIIKSMMTKKVVTARRKDSLKETIKKMAKRSLSCLVVTEKREPIGIFTKRDLLSVLDAGMDLNKTALDKVMRTPVLPIDENETFFSAARQMGIMDVRRFIVVDRPGKLVGIVTQTDIVKFFATRTFPYNLTIAAVSGDGLTVSASGSLKKVARLMMENRKTCVTVVKNRQPVGLLTEQVFVNLAARVKDPLKYSAGQKMVKKFPVVNIGSSVRESVLKMLKDGFHNLVLVDDRGRYAGAVEQGDLVGFIEESHR